MIAEQERLIVGCGRRRRGFFNPGELASGYFGTADDQLFCLTTFALLIYFARVVFVAMVKRRRDIIAFVQE